MTAVVKAVKRISGNARLTDGLGQSVVASQQTSTFPVFFPEFLAYMGSIWEIPALGGVPRRIVNSMGGADVSPTGGRLVLFRLAKEGIQLVTAPTDGS